MCYWHRSWHITSSHSPWTWFSHSVDEGNIFLQNVNTDLIHHLLPAFSNTTCSCGPLLPRQSSSIPPGLWPFYSNFLFPLSSNPLQPHWSIFSVVFVFSLFTTSWQLLFVLAFFHYSMCPYNRNLSDFINFTVSSPCNISPISSSVQLSSFVTGQ